MSDSEELQDLPLPALFQRGRAILKQLEGLAVSDNRTQQLAQQGVTVWQQAAHAVDALALFSSNEELEDLSTADIKYLLIPFFHAEVLGHTNGDNPNVRLDALTRAAEHYRAFLHHCRQYGLLSPPATVLADAVLQKGGNGSSRNGSSTMDAATLRQSKIEKFKRERYITGRMEELHKQQQQQRQGGEEEGGQDGDADEAERELWLLQTDLSALQAAERLGTLEQEVQILRHAASMPEDERQREREQRQQAGPPSDLFRQLQTAASNLTSATAQRQRMAAEVFRPSYVLPSMSVEQFGELEYHRMVEQQQREAAAKERHDRQQAERKKDDVEEEELQKQRAWDEFKDDNPRGWGNSKLRPCS